MIVASVMTGDSISFIANLSATFLQGASERSCRKSQESLIANDAEMHYICPYQDFNTANTITMSIVFSKLDCHIATHCTTVFSTARQKNSTISKILLFKLSLVAPKCGQHHFTTLKSVTILNTIYHFSPIKNSLHLSPKISQKLFKHTSFFVMGSHSSDHQLPISLNN